MFGGPACLMVDSEELNEDCPFVSISAAIYIICSIPLSCFVLQVWEGSIIGDSGNCFRAICESVAGIGDLSQMITITEVSIKRSVLCM